MNIKYDKKISKKEAIDLFDGPTDGGRLIRENNTPYYRQ